MSPACSLTYKHSDAITGMPAENESRGGQDLYVVLLGRSMGTLVLHQWLTATATPSDKTYTFVSVTSPEEPADSTGGIPDTDVEVAAEHLSWSEAFARLEEFAGLPARWDSYDADPISPIALAQARSILFALRRAFAFRFGERFMPVNIAPIADGGIQFEWERDDFYLEIELTPGGDIAYFMTEGEGRNRRSAGEEGIPTGKALELVTAFLNVSATCWITW